MYGRLIKAVELTQSPSPFLSGAAKEWAAVQTWSRDELLRKYGALHIEVGEPDLLPKEIGEGVKRAAPLSEFVRVMDRRRESNGPPVMAFDTIEFPVRANLDAEMQPRLPFFEHWNMTVPYFTWGAENLGLPFHAHSAAYTPTIFGSKQWFLSNSTTELVPTIHEMNRYFNTLMRRVYETGRWPPEVERADIFTWPLELRTPDPHDFDAIVPYPYLMTAAAQDEKAARMETCATAAGDVMYVPEKWWHATLNLEETVALPFQDTNQWKTHTEQLWFRIDKLVSQNRREEAIELLEQGRQLHDLHASDPVNYEGFRTNLKNELVLVLRSHLEKKKCVKGMEVANRIQVLLAAEQDAMRQVEDWADDDLVGRALLNVALCWAMRGEFGQAVALTLRATEMSKDAEKQARLILTYVKTVEHVISEG